MPLDTQTTVTDFAGLKQQLTTLTAMVQTLQQTVLQMNAIIQNIDNNTKE